MKDEIRLMSRGKLTDHLIGVIITPELADAIAHLFVNAEDKPRNYSARFVANLADEVENIPKLIKVTETATQERAA